MAIGQPTREHARERVDAARVRYEGSWIQHLLVRLREIEAFDWTTIFGAELLWSVLPLLILLSSIANHRIEDDLSRHIGLDTHGAHVVEGMFRGTPSHAIVPIATGLLFALTGTLAVVGSMQLLYERLFGQEHRGWRGTPRIALWVIALLGALAAQVLINGPVNSAVGPVGEVLVRSIAETFFFWWTMHFLLAGRVPWRVLLRPATVTTILWLVLALASSLFFSSTMVSDSREYGTIGVVFTLLTWFVLIGTVVVLGAAIGAVWNERAVRDVRPARPGN
jgi:membrane protein